MYLLRYFHIDRPVFLLENRVHKRKKHRKVHAKHLSKHLQTSISSATKKICQTHLTTPKYCKKRKYCNMYGTMYSMYGENFKFRAYTTEFVAV